MDWELIESIARKIVDACERERAAADADVTTMLAVLFLVVTSFDSSTVSVEGKRPDSLVQFYAWTKQCLNAMRKAFPEGPPN